MFSPDSVVVILAAPENPLNVGFVARAMVCNGVRELRIVGSDWKELPDEARRTGTAAPEVLDRVRFFETIGAAGFDCRRVIGFSRRQFDLPMEQLNVDDPAQMQMVKELSGKTALLFGRESNGLTREEFKRCDFLCALPTAAGSSYNLGMAAAVAFHTLIDKTEIVAGQAIASERKIAAGRENGSRSSASTSLPTVEEREAFLEHLNRLFDTIGSSTLQRENREVFRTLLRRSAPNQAELRALFGLLKEVLHKQNSTFGNR